MNGEGFAVATATEFSAEGKQQVRFELSDVGAPERTFFSDAVLIKAAAQGYKFCYFQSDSNGTKPRALLEIYMSAGACEQFATTLTEMPPDIEPTAFNIDTSQEPTNSVCYQANFVRLARGGLSAAGDFYFASPWGLLHGERHGSAYMSPVVRVNMTDAVFAETIRKFMPER